MTAKEKIEELTTAWYGFALFGAIVSLVQNGIGFFSLFGTGASLMFSLALSWFLGRRLLAKSSFFRLLLLVVSFIGICVSGLGVFKLGASFLGSFSFGVLLLLALGTGWLWMSFRSFRVLTDKSVKAYFG